MIRPARRRAMTLLVAAPLVCGLLLAGGIAAAWLALGEPVPAHGAVWFQVTKLGAARATVVVVFDAEPEPPPEHAVNPTAAAATTAIAARERNVPRHRRREEPSSIGASG